MGTSYLKSHMKTPVRIVIRITAYITIVFIQFVLTVKIYTYSALQVHLYWKFAGFFIATRDKEP